MFDRVTDYPLLIGASLFCSDVVPMELVAVKIAVDLLLLALFALAAARSADEGREVALTELEEPA